MVFVLLLVAVVVSVGRRVYNEETALFVEVFCNSRDAELLSSCRKSAYALTSFLRSRSFQLRDEKQAKQETEVSPRGD